MSKKELLLPKPLVNLPKPDFLQDYNKDKQRFTINQTQDITDSRFRKRYRQLSDAEILFVDEIKDTAARLEFLYNLMGRSGENLYNAVHYLETSVMYGVKEATGKPLEDAAGNPITVDQVKRIILRAKRIKAN